MRRYLWGFPGIGKSSLVGVDGIRVVDADAAMFQFLDVAADKLHSGALDGYSGGPNPEYPENYFKYIRDIDADLVFVNCHLGLFPDLDAVLVVYPDRQLKEEYLERYRNRGDNDSFVSYMEEEFEGMVDYLDSLPVSKIKITENNIFLQDVLESEEFRMKVLTRKEVAAELQRAMDLKVVDTKVSEDGVQRLAFDSKFATEDIDHRISNAQHWAAAVLDGHWEMDIDDLRKACDAREAQIERERVMLERRGGLSREELEDKIMQGIVNGALGISYGEIAPYSHGYEVTFGGEGPVGSTRAFQNRWECYCPFFDIPGKIVDAIENGKQDRRVFGAAVKPFDIGTLLTAIDDMEGKKLQSFVPEKDTNFERWNVPYRRDSVATVQDVHAGKGLDGIVQHHYHGDYASMTPGNYNSLVERLVYMKGFCLDCLHMMSGGSEDRQKVIDFLKKQGIDVSTPEKLRAWIRENPEKCGIESNRVVKRLDDKFYAQAYIDYVELKALVDAHKGSLDDFIFRHKLFGEWYENSFDTSFGALTDVYLFKREDGSFGLSDGNICVWDHEHDVGEEGLLFSDIKAKCEKIGFNLTELENEALQNVEIHNNPLSNKVSAQFGLSQEVYDDLRRKGMNDADIWVTVKAWGLDAVERGYDIFTCSGSEVVVEGALVVEMIGDLERFESDFDACRQAEKDGFKFINDMDGLEKGCYLDTPENRALCENWLKEHPEYRIENWLDLNSEYGKKYVAHFGPVMSMKNWKVPLAEHGMGLYQKWNGMMEADVQKGIFDGTADYEDRIHSVQDAAGWMLATYEDTALEVIGDWIHDFECGVCWDIPLKEIQIELEKCFGFERDFPTLEEIMRDYDTLMALIGDVRTPEQAIDFANEHHTWAEVNGDSAHLFIKQCEECWARGEAAPEIEWIRYDDFGCLSYVYDYFDGKPILDIYCKDGCEFVADIKMETLTAEKYEEIVDKLRDEFMTAKAQQKALQGKTQGQVNELIEGAASRAGQMPVRGSEKEFGMG